MLTVKRKVDTEEERYGGFEVATDKSFDMGYDLDINQSYSTAQTVKGETLNYSPRETQVESSAPTKRKLHTEELMPGIVKPKQREEVNYEYDVKPKMDSKTKVMLAVYMVVVMALAAIVIATGVAISSANARVISLNQDIAARNATIIEQNANLEMLNSDNFIKGSAYENGMVEVTNPTEIELMPVEEITSYTRSTNWFDKFCDFVSDIFGG